MAQNRVGPAAKFATSVMFACVFDVGESHATHARGCSGWEFCEGSVEVSHEEGDIDVGEGVLDRRFMGMEVAEGVKG